MFIPVPLQMFIGAPAGGGMGIGSVFMHVFDELRLWFLGNF
jgi:hypothetical protein